MNRDSIWDQEEADAYNKWRAAKYGPAKYGPGAGRRDHRDDGCFQQLMIPGVVVASLVLLRWKRSARPVFRPGRALIRWVRK